MLTYVLRRLLYSIPVLILTSFIIFMFVSISGDPLAELRQTPNLSQATVDNITEAKHLDDPLIVQYGYWVKDALTNGFGTTLLADQPILPDITRVMGNTLQLVIAAEIIAIVIGVLVGVISAVRQYSVFDYSATTFSFVGYSVPIFWLALILQVLAVNFLLETGIRIVYVSGLSDPSASNWLVDRIQHLALPIATLAFISMAQYSRYARASMLEVINSDYVRTARSKGLRERRVILKHGFRNALIPVTTVAALNFGAVLGGAIITEQIFSIDGMGSYFIDALGHRDVYPLMAWLMVVSVLVILFNLLADVVYGWLDPRIRYD